MSFVDKRVLVTGAAGFIGSNLVDRMLENNCEVFGMDNFDKFYSGKEKNLASCINKKNFELIKSDILDYEKLVSSMKDIDIVFHLAARPGIGFSMENPSITIKNNIEGTLNVLKACKECNVKRIVNASSSSVYGIPKELPVNEEHSLNPLSVYGVTKLATEKLCTVFSTTYNQSIVSLRYHSVYGPRARPDLVTYKWMDSLFKEKPIIIFGDGYQTRDMTFVDDIVEGTLLAAQEEENGHEIFNIANGRNVSMNYVLELLSELIGVEPKINYKPIRSYEAKDMHADISKAKQVFDYYPKTTIEEGLKQSVMWYKQMLD